MNIRKQYRHKTEFICQPGEFQFIGMSFSLTNAPECFQRALDIILTKYKCNTFLVYLKDVIFFSGNVADDIGHVDDLLANLHEAVVTLNINNCHFFQKQV